MMWFVERVRITPDFLGEWLPGMVLLGIGGGTLFPNLSGTAVGSAPGESFATATGMNSVARQIGAALGVAIVVAIIGPRRRRPPTLRSSIPGHSVRSACSSPELPASWLGPSMSTRHRRSAMQHELFSQRSFPIRPARPTDVLVVGRADFERLLESSPALSLALNRSLGRQLRGTHASAPTVRPRPTTVTLIALDAGIPLQRIAARLSDALRAHVSIAVLGEAEETALAGPGESATTYGPLLDHAEAEHDLVLLIGGFAVQPEPWTTFCLQQADRILALTAGGPVPPALARFPELQACDLVAYDTAAGELDGWATALHPGRVARDTRDRIQRR
jgi:hypothetical protein